MTDRYERTRDPVEGEGRAITAVQVTLFGRECFLPADIAQEVEKACAAHDLANGEEIMVNAAHDVYTLPLQPSGLSSGPRFVVHVPGPEQPAEKPEVTCAVCEELVERIGNGYVPNGSREEQVSLREAALERLTATNPAPQQAAAVAVDEGSRVVSGQLLHCRVVIGKLLHWGGVPVHVTGTVTTSPGNWSLIDAALATQHQEPTT